MVRAAMPFVIQAPPNASAAEPAKFMQEISVAFAPATPAPAEARFVASPFAEAPRQDVLPAAPAAEAQGFAVPADMPVFRPIEDTAAAFDLAPAPDLPEPAAPEQAPEPPWQPTGETLSSFAIAASLVAEDSAAEGGLPDDVAPIVTEQVELDLSRLRDAIKALNESFTTSPAGTDANNPIVTFSEDDEPESSFADIVGQAFGMKRA